MGRVADFEGVYSVPMAKRLPKPVRCMLFGTLGLLLAVVIVGGLALFLSTPRAPVRIEPTQWTRLGAGERIEVNGYTFEMPIDGLYARLDGSHGPDLEGAIIIREDPKRPWQLVVGRISQLTPDTAIHPDGIGKAFIEIAQETRDRGDDLRLATLPPRNQDSPAALQRVVGMCLPADAYLFSNGNTFTLEHMTTIMESWAPVEADAD